MTYKYETEIYKAAQEMGEIEFCNFIKKKYAIISYPDSYARYMRTFYECCESFDVNPLELRTLSRTHAIDKIKRAIVYVMHMSHPSLTANQIKKIITGKTDVQFSITDKIRACRDTMLGDDEYRDKINSLIDKIKYL